jgi:hypothetical protein
MSAFDAAVKRLAEDHPDQIPVLRVMCRLAADAEKSGRPQFDAEAVRINLGGGLSGNLSLLVRRGFVTANDESRQHRYYEMRDWREAEQALSRLGPSV